MQNFIYPLYVFVFDMEIIQQFIRVNSCLNEIIQLYLQTIHERKVSDTVLK
jgi:hypothetical protein